MVAVGPLQTDEGGAAHLHIVEIHKPLNARAWLLHLVNVEPIRCPTAGKLLEHALGAVRNGDGDSVEGRVELVGAVELAESAANVGVEAGVPCCARVGQARVVLKQHAVLRKEVVESAPCRGVTAHDWSAMARG